MFPDVLALLVAYLGGVLPSAHVCAQLPPGAGFDGSLPIVRVTRVGGPSRYRGIHDAPVVELDVYASSLEQATDLTAEVRAALLALRNSKHPGAAVTSVREIAGPSERPEENPNVIRLGFTAALVVRAN